MTIHEMFEQCYADKNGHDAKDLVIMRLSNGSYQLPSIARAFLYFSAGYEAAKTEQPDKTGDNHEQ